jgi:hypothetical protein
MISAIAKYFELQADQSFGGQDNDQKVNFRTVIFDYGRLSISMWGGGDQA